MEKIKVTVEAWGPFGDWDFISSEQNSIEEVADLCPVFGGPAVFWARNMRMSYDPAVMYNDTLCSETWGERIARDDIEVSESPVTLYPNPATTELYVDVNGHEYNEWRLFSIDGKLISSGSIPENELLKISLHKVDSGQYFLKLSGIKSASTYPFVIQNQQR